jgi:hypothetical protein
VSEPEQGSGPDLRRALLVEDVRSLSAMLEEILATAGYGGCIWGSASSTT